MKTKPSSPINSSFPSAFPSSFGETSADARIDAVLGAYGRAVPAIGLEARVAARISAAPEPSYRSWRSPRLMLLRRLSVGALAAAAAYGIIVGTVRHSQHIAMPLAARAAQAGGVTSAGSVHIPTRAIPVTTTINPAAPRTPAHGRAASAHQQERPAQQEPTSSH